MTLAAFTGHCGVVLHGTSGAPAFASHLMDASGEKYAVILNVPKTGNIRKIYFRTGTVTTGDTIACGIYTVDTAGDPTSTGYGGMAAGTVAVADADDNAQKVVTLATDAAATKGDVIAIVLSFSSYVAGNLNIVSYQGANSAYIRPYGDLLSGAGPTWGKQPQIPVMAIEYDDGTFGRTPGVLPFTGGLSTVSVATNVTAREIAVKVNLPVPCRVLGMTGIRAVGATADYETHTYDSSTVDVATAITIPAETNALTSSRVGFVPFPAGSLSKATVYRLAFKPTSTNAMTGNIGTAPSAAALAQITGASGVMCYSWRDSGGTWTDVDAAMLLECVEFDQFDDGAGASGGGLKLVGSGGLAG